MSANFSKLPASDQATLHGRMREWASLSTAERNRARLNFAQTKELSAKEKRAQWEAYQALSPEQKRRLAAQASPRPAGAAPAVTPRGTGKLASVPVTRSEADGARSSGPELRAAAPERTASQP